MKGVEDPSKLGFRDCRISQGKVGKEEVTNIAIF